MLEDTEKKDTRDGSLVTGTFDRSKPPAQAVEPHPFLSTAWGFRLLTLELASRPFSGLMISGMLKSSQLHWVPGFRSLAILTIWKRSIKRTATGLKCDPTGWRPKRNALTSNGKV